MIGSRAGLDVEGIAAWVAAVTGGGMPEDRVIDVVTSIVSGPDAVAEVIVGGARVGVGVVIDTCANATDAAELSVFAEDDGVLAALLAWGEARAARGPRRCVEVPCWPGASVPGHMLEARGYTVSYEMFDMLADPPSAERVPPPAGMRFVDATPPRAAAYHAVVSGAFAEVPGAFVPALDLFCSRLLALDPPPRLLLDGDEVLGFVRVEPEGDQGELASVGRRPDRRGAGLGPVLVSEALRLLTEAGARRVKLEVAAKNRRAMALYERFGFRAVSGMAVWGKVIKR